MLIGFFLWGAWRVMGLCRFFLFLASPLSVLPLLEVRKQRFTEQLERELSNQGNDMSRNPFYTALALLGLIAIYQCSSVDVEEWPLMDTGGAGSEPQSSEAGMAEELPVLEELEQRAPASGEADGAEAR